jgi:hypothetical protein
LKYDACCAEAATAAKARASTVIESLDIVFIRFSLVPSVLIVTDCPEALPQSIRRLLTWLRPGNC